MLTLLHCQPEDSEGARLPSVEYLDAGASEPPEVVHDGPVVAPAELEDVLLLGWRLLSSAQMPAVRDWSNTTIFLASRPSKITSP